MVPAFFVVSTASPAAACADANFYELIAADLADFDQPDGSLATRHAAWIEGGGGGDPAVPAISRVDKFEIVQVVEGNEQLTSGGVEALTTTWGAELEDPELQMWIVDPQDRGTEYAPGEECGQAPIVDAELGRTRYRVITDQRTHWINDVPESVSSNLDAQLEAPVAVTPDEAALEGRIDGLEERLGTSSSLPLLPLLLGAGVILAGAAGLAVKKSKSSDQQPVG